MCITVSGSKCLRRERVILVVSGGGTGLTERKYIWKTTRK